ncbi:TRIP4_1 [Blepharisma stoltei]|uniref:Kinesin motor domain-containing protein n=1 Tax=Blepharisma stoltei TaxID=1481888 RepID=A0AAU9J1Y4_9CILI|nr:unnamed protein product [Blepharisma stoltei]
MSDSSIQVMLRVRPADPESYENVYAIASNNTDIQFFLPDKEPQGFQFHKIFQPFCSQNDIFDQAASQQVDQFLSGHDALVFACGPEDSGKSYSLFGNLSPNNEANGVIPKALVHVFKKIETMKSRKEIGVIASFVEIYMNQVRDLGNTKAEEGKSVFEIDNFDNPGYISGLSANLINSYNDVQRMIQHGFGLRENLWRQEKGHLILKISMTAKEKNSASNSNFYFVELAGIGDQKEDKTKYKELDFLNTSFIAVKKAILNIQKGTHVQHKDSLITWVLQSVLNERSSILFLAHVNPNPIFSDKIIETLDNAQQCISLTNRPKVSQEPSNLVNPQQIKRMQKVEDDIQELNNQIDKTLNDHSAKLKALGKLVGIPINLMDIVDAEYGSKEYEIAKRYYEAFKKAEKIEKRNKKIENEIFIGNSMMEEFKRGEVLKSKKTLNHAEKLREKISEVKHGITDTQLQSKQIVHENVIERAEELQKLLLHSHMLLEEKASVVHNLPYTMKSKAADIRNLVDIKESSKEDVLPELINKFKLNEEDHAGVIELIKHKNEAKLKELDSEALRFELECNEYNRRKESHYKTIETEIIQIYAIFEKHDTLIKEIEQGVYNGGIKPIYMLATEIPKPPTREKYPHLFKALTENKFLTSKTDNSNIRIWSHPVTMKYKNLRQSLALSSPKPNTAALPMVNTYMTQTEKGTKSDELTQSLQAEINSATDQEILMMGQNLQEAIKSLSKEIKNLKKFEENELGKVQAMEMELDRVITERDKGRELYTQNVKNRMDSKIVIDSQKRLLDRYIFITEQLSSRPSTGKKRPQTSSTQRPGTAKESNRDSSKAYNSVSQFYSSQASVGVFSRRL